MGKVLVLQVVFHAALLSCTTAAREWKSAGQMPEILKPYVKHEFVKTLSLVQKDKSIGTILSDGRILEATSFAVRDANPKYSVLFKAAEHGTIPITRPRRMTVHRNAHPIPAVDGDAVENSEVPLSPRPSDDIELQKGIDEMHRRKASICEDTSINPIPSDLDSEILEAVFILHFNEYEVDNKQYYTLLNIDEVVYGRAGRAIQEVLTEMEKDKKNCNTASFATMQYSKYDELNSGRGKKIVDTYDQKIRADSTWLGGNWKLSFVGSDEGVKQSVLVYKDANPDTNTFVAYAVVGKKFSILRGEAVSTSAEEQAKINADKNVASIRPQLNYGATRYYNAGATPMNAFGAFDNARVDKIIFILTYIQDVTKQEELEENSKFSTNLVLCYLTNTKYGIVVLEVPPNVHTSFIRTVLNYDSLAAALIGAEEFAENYRFWYYAAVGKNKSYNSIKSSAEKKINATLETKEKDIGNSADNAPADWNFQLISSINIVPETKIEGVKTLRLFFVECTNKTNNLQKFVGVVKGSTSESLDGRRLNSSSSELKPNSKGVTFNNDAAVPSSSSSQNPPSKSIESSNSSSDLLRTSIGSSGELPVFRALSGSRSFQFLRGSKNANASNWVISEIFETPNTLLNSPNSYFENIYVNRQHESVDPQ